MESRKVKRLKNIFQSDKKNMVYAIFLLIQRRAFEEWLPPHWPPFQKAAKKAEGRNWFRDFNLSSPLWGVVALFTWGHCPCPHAHLPLPVGCALIHRTQRPTHMHVLSRGREPQLMEHQTAPWAACRQQRQMEEKMLGTKVAQQRTGKILKREEKNTNWNLNIVSLIA